MVRLQMLPVTLLAAMTLPTPASSSLAHAKMRRNPATCIAEQFVGPMGLKPTRRDKLGSALAGVGTRDACLSMCVSLDSLVTCAGVLFHLKQKQCQLYREHDKADVKKKVAAGGEFYRLDPINCPLSSARLPFGGNVPERLATSIAATPTPTIMPLPRTRWPPPSSAPFSQPSSSSTSSTNAPTTASRNPASFESSVDREMPARLLGVQGPSFDEPLETKGVDSKSISLIAVWTVAGLLCAFALVFFCWLYYGRRARGAGETAQTKLKRGVSPTEGINVHGDERLAGLFQAFDVGQSEDLEWDTSTIGLWEPDVNSAGAESGDYTESYSQIGANRSQTPRAGGAGQSEHYQQQRHNVSPLSSYSPSNAGKPVYFEDSENEYGLFAGCADTEERGENVDDGQVGNSPESTGSRLSLASRSSTYDNGTVSAVSAVSQPRALSCRTYERTYERNDGGLSAVQNVSRLAKRNSTSTEM